MYLCNKVHHSQRESLNIVQRPAIWPLTLDHVTLISLRNNYSLEAPFVSSSVSVSQKGHLILNGHFYKGHQLTLTFKHVTWKLIRNIFLLLVNTVPSLVTFKILVYRPTDREKTIWFIYIHNFFWNRGNLILAIRSLFLLIFLHSTYFI